MTAILKTALEAIRNAANTNMQHASPRDADWIVLAGPPDPGGAPDPVRDTIVMAIFNIAADAALRNAVPARTGGAAQTSGAPLFLTVHLMFAANFAPGNYSDGLAALSRLILFFQQSPVFTAENTPELDPAIDRIVLELENLALADVHHLTAMLGARYQPSVFYRLRGLPVDASANRVILPVIERPSPG